MPEFEQVSEGAMGRRGICTVRAVEDETLDPRLFEHLGYGSAFEVVLRGHLWVEAQLTAVVTDVLPFPDLVDMDRFTFPQRVALAAAHGFIRPDDVAAYMRLNALRNRLAHRVNVEPGADFADELLSAFGPHLRRLVDDFSRGERWQWEDWVQRLRLCVLAMCVSVDNERQRLLAYRREVREANERLRVSAQRLLDAAGEGRRER